MERQAEKMKVKMSKYDLLDKFEAYQTEATFTKGNKMTTQVVAMADVEKIVDEIVQKLGNGKNYISNNS